MRRVAIASVGEVVIQIICTCLGGNSRGLSGNLAVVAD
jgi:hypothetical protein